VRAVWHSPSPTHGAHLPGRCPGFIGAWRVSLFSSLGAVSPVSGVRLAQAMRE